jgi:hypothetical protein
LAADAASSGDFVTLSASAAAEFSVIFHHLGLARPVEVVAVGGDEFARSAQSVEIAVGLRDDVARHHIPASPRFLGVGPWGPRLSRSTVAAHSAGTPAHSGRRRGASERPMPSGEVLISTCHSLRLRRSMPSARRCCRRDGIAREPATHELLWQRGIAVGVGGADRARTESKRQDLYLLYLPSRHRGPARAEGK